VGGQIPVATGAAFTSKYLKKKEISICFLGDGAVAQGSFHESLNLAALWTLPCIFVIENNQWGMGTAVARAISVEPIAEKKAESFGMKGYTVNGMDFFDCYSAFEHIFEEIQKTHAPVLVEMITERFKGHSISDPGLYRSKECLSEAMERDPIQLLLKELISVGMITDEEYEILDRKQKELVLAAMKFAEESPSPDPITLEEDVYAP
jgi:pyruvate dehydrogenase E1 component alpha subunit